MKHRITIAIMVVVAALVAGACSASSSDTAGTDTTTANDVEVTTVPGDAAASDTTTPDTTQATTTTTGSEPVIVGADPITQITPTSGGGTRPLLEWEPIDGAALYFVTLYTETGGPYWSAVTEKPQTYVGGPLQIPAGRTGPNVAEGYTWVVYAEDADGVLLAASPSRLITP